MSSKVSLHPLLYIDEVAALVAKGNIKGPLLESLSRFI